ncbi:MAG: Gldg family protein [Candidatus Sumerlaeia bacterium]|nr:Gldg family protein [Candidatus Sumerlaeia bacterium]
MSRNVMGALGLLIAAVLLLGVNILSQNLLRGARVDLTQNKLYTLSEGSRNVVRNLDEPIRLRFYFSDKKTNNIPFLRSYATRVREFLEEYVAASNGMLTLEVIDPEPFSEAEDMAVAAGLQGVPISQGERIYFGLQGISTTDLEDRIPFFSENREDFLEYDITSMIYNLGNPDRRKIAVISGIPISGSEVDPMAAMMGQAQDTEPWIIYQILQENFEVEELSPNVATIPEDVEVLVLVHPKDLTDQAQYAIDQFTLGGGRVLAFIDPNSEAYEPPQDPSNPMAAFSADRSSNIPRLLESWGLRMDQRQVVLDRRHSEEVNVGSRERPEISRYVAWLNLTSDKLNKEEFTVSQLQNLRFATPGFLEKLDDAETEFIPLVRSSEDSMVVPAERIRFAPQPRDLLANFAADPNEYILAARITGNTRTAFPEGVNGDLPENHRAQSDGPINVIVVADVDVLDDMRWVSQQNFFGQMILSPTASNGDMFINFVDQLSGSSDLIGIRGRAGFNRPFTAVKKLEEAALERFAAKRKELEDRLVELDQRLNELRRGQGTDGPIMVTEDHRRELERFQEQRVETNRELRRVNYALRHDIEKLGSRIKFYNIVLVPVVVGLIAVGLGIFRAQRRKFLRK